MSYISNTIINSTIQHFSSKKYKYSRISNNFIIQILIAAANRKMLRIQFYLFSYYIGFHKNPLSIDKKVSATDEIYNWSICEYEQATIYRFGLQDETCPGSWKFHCEFFDEKNPEFEWMVSIFY